MSGADLLEISHEKQEQNGDEKVKIKVSTPIIETARVLQVRGIFDMKEEQTSTTEWDVDLPINQKKWNIGLIVGPSGCGKSTIAKHFWPNQISFTPSWPSNECAIDAFPDMPIKDITEILNSVGFSSPPAWLRPYHVLSTGQKFRVSLARMIAEADANPSSDPIVFDEYTSVVDRTVAKIGSAAMAKTIRKRGLQFIAITCHEDVEEWLQPDWVYRPAERTFAWRSVQRRPAIEIEIFRCYYEAWPVFAPHHYMSDDLHTSAFCFLATWQSQPVAFSAWLPFVGAGPPTRREHRTVTLPDFQGVGLGNALSDTIASMWKALGQRAKSTTTHPAMIRSRSNSPNWAMVRKPGLAKHNVNRNKYTQNLKHATTRLTCGFDYVGPAMEREAARKLLAS